MRWGRMLRRNPLVVSDGLASVVSRAKRRRMRESSYSLRKPWSTVSTSCGFRTSRGRGAVFMRSRMADGDASTSTSTASGAWTSRWWSHSRARRTRGFGTPTTFPICGERGGLPRRGRPIPPGSLAEQAARYGTARYAHDGGCAAIARPVFWKGKLAKAVVVAVPENDSAVLGPQMVASDMPGRRRRPVAAGPW